MSYFQDNMMQALELILKARPGHGVDAVTVPRRALLMASGLVRYRRGYDHPRELEITPHGLNELQAWRMARAQAPASGVAVAAIAPRRFAPLTADTRILPIPLPAPRVRLI